MVDLPDRVGLDDWKLLSRELRLAGYRIVQERRGLVTYNYVHDSNDKLLKIYVYRGTAWVNEKKSVSSRISQ